MTAQGQGQLISSLQHFPQKQSIKVELQIFRNTAMALRLHMPTN